MPVDVDEVLEGRSRRSPRRQQATAVAAALVLHALLVTAAFALPRLTREERELPQYVEVHVLPATALGLERPRPAPPPEPKAPPPEPEPAPEPPPPEPDPEIPVLPQEEPEPAPSRHRGRPRPAGPPARPSRHPRRRRRRGAVPGRAGHRARGCELPVRLLPGTDAGQDPSELGEARRSRGSRPPSSSGCSKRRDRRRRDPGVVREPRLRPGGARAVRNASPLPPLPTSYREDVLTVNLIVR